MERQTKGKGLDSVQLCGMNFVLKVLGTKEYKSVKLRLLSLSLLYPCLALFLGVLHFLLYIHRSGRVTNFLFIAALPLPCIIVNANRRVQKRGDLATRVSSDLSIKL